MKRRFGLLSIAVLFAAAAPAWAQADVLQAIPEDAIGFAVINRVSQTNDKLTAVAKRLKVDLPGNLLEMAKGALGVQKGLAEKGSVAVAAFAPQGDEHPRGVVYIPVTDYKAFLEQLKPGETKDGITAITLKDGKAMLAGKRGNYALLTDTKERDALALALQSSKTLAAWGEPLTAWLGENDVAGVLTLRGLKEACKHARKGIDEAKQNFGALPAEAQFVVKIFDAMEEFTRSVETDVTHAGLGVRVDAAGNVVVAAKALFKKGSGFAKAGAAIKAAPGGPIAGLPSGPFVFAMGAVVPEKLMQALGNMNSEIMKAAGQAIPEDTLKKLEKAQANSMKGIKGIGFVWQVGKEGSALFNNIVSVMQTDNASAYMAEYEKSIAATNEVMKELNLPFLPTYDLKKVKVGGKDALEMSMDFGGNLPIPDAEKIFKSMFGADGKMRISVAARDDKTVIMRYSGADGLRELLSGQSKALATDADVVQVSKALPVGSQWAFYLSPKGTVDFADRAIKTFSPFPLAIPQFPATPPVAVGASVSGQGMDMHLVVPAGVVDNIHDFINQLKGLFGGA